MSRYRHELDNARLHVASLWVVIVLLAVFLAWAMRGWQQAPHDMTLHVPPDLSQGTTLRNGEIPKPNVYSFAFYMWQQINRWREDGARDYGNNLYSYAAYMTPSFREDLVRDMERRGRRGELAGRVRALHELPGAGYEDRRVDLVGPGVWVVWLDTTIEETVAGLDVKTTNVRYPLRVVRYDVDREANPWGMALDGFAEDPARLPDAIKEETP